MKITEYEKGKQDEREKTVSILKKEIRKCTIAMRDMDEYDRYNRTQIFKGQSVKKNFAEKVLRHIKKN
ncbi:MAG: hypothetical protein KJI69_04995 [Patescibacteria group bacterium]|nr:hypothetical protein [Patescibacteria group bacterium]